MWGLGAVTLDRGARRGGRAAGLTVYDYCSKYIDESLKTLNLGNFILELTKSLLGVTLTVTNACRYRLNSQLNA